ncbi:MAG: hypothetical protein F4Z31_06140 [Gemmatimonadetes bacterium]|nr:hypothetical protein [Gemmatimonadota bacterium]
MTTTNLLHRFLQPNPSTYNAQTREVEAVIASGSPVERRDARGTYIEILNPGGLEVERSINAPVLDSHNSMSVDALLGRIQGISVQNGEVHAKLRFSNSSSVLPHFEKIGDGTIQKLSIGYEVLSRQNGVTNGQRTITITGWVIREVSLVVIPLDQSTGFRSQQPLNLINGDRNMDPNQQQPQNQTPQQQPISGENDRTQIRALAKDLEIDSAVADKLIDRGASLSDAKSEFFDVIQNRSKQQTQIRVTSTQDDPETFERRAVKSLILRMGGELEKDDKEAGAIRPLMSRTIGDLAIEHLQRNGEDVRGVTPSLVWERSAGSLTTTDFPKLLVESSNRVLLDAYMASMTGLKQLCTRRDLSDFRETDAIRLSEMGRLEELAEDGEITATSRSEESEPMSIKTYARKIHLSRKALVNDNLMAFGSMVQDCGNAAAQTEADLLSDKINNPGNLADGRPVFELSTARSGKGRGNISAGSVLTVQYDLGTPRQALRERKSLDGKTILGLRPAYLLVASNLETIGEKLLAAIQPDEVQHANPFSGQLMLVVEPRLTADSAYMVAMPMDAPSLSYSYLSSRPMVQIEQAEDFSTLAMKWRVVLDFGANWVGHRGWQKLQA